MDKPLLYFKTNTAWRKWLHENHKNYNGIYLVFYKVASKKTSMRWEEAVKVALCYGWIDSTVKKIDNEKRKQYFTPRKPKSVWSKVNKTYLEQLFADGLMHQNGVKSVEIAKENGSWDTLNDVDNEVIPPELKASFEKHPIAYKNYKNFATSYRKSYLYWLHSAKREATRQKRISQIIKFCTANKKQLDGSW
ncbi:MAG: YdeI/OmpD-associated family protein [Flavobacteriaceae bacterium]|nr:YdeI/OmpD-associated family protein [Flavobacteriaceae bacterium]